MTTSNEALTTWRDASQAADSFCIGCIQAGSDMLGEGLINAEEFGRIVARALADRIAAHKVADDAFEAMMGRPLTA